MERFVTCSECPLNLIDAACDAYPGCPTESEAVSLRVGGPDEEHF
jgi:hypothetical protein